MAQKYESKDTSLAQVCAVYTTFTKPNNRLFRKGDRVLDYGGGKYDLGKEFMKGYGVNVSVYDPFNRTPSHNKAVMQKFKRTPPEVIVCSNVLNVIQEESVIKGIVKEIKGLCGRNTIVIFSIYEGNKTGVGKPTTKGYQRNEPTMSYLRFMTPFANAIRKGKFIICRPN